MRSESTKNRTRARHYKTQKIREVPTFKKPKEKNQNKPFSIELQDHPFVFQALQPQILFPEKGHEDKI